MTNSQTLFGSLIWVAITSALTLILFEPIPVAQQPAPTQISANAAAADHAAL